MLPSGASDKINERIQAVTHFELGELGYYSHEAMEADTSRTFAEMKTWWQDRCNDFGGQWADLILRIEPGDEDGFNIGLVADKTSRFRAQLFSKSEGKVIWDQESEGRDRGLGLAPALLAGRESFRKALTQLFETLPSIYVE